MQENFFILQILTLIFRCLNFLHPKIKEVRFMPIIRVRPWNWLTREEGREAGTLPVANPAHAKGHESLNPSGAVTMKF